MNHLWLLLLFNFIDSPNNFNLSFVFYEVFTPLIDLWLKRALLQLLQLSVESRRVFRMISDPFRLAQLPKPVVHWVLIWICRCFCVDLRFEGTFFESVCLFLNFLLSNTLMLELVFFQEDVHTSLNIDGRVWRLMKDGIGRLGPKISKGCRLLVEGVGKVLLTSWNYFTCQRLITSFLRWYRLIEIFILNLLIKLSIDKLSEMSFL
jgi:hypothetical protein